MAKKRMFSLDIVDTDKFLEMPLTDRYLYYELGMRGDDDGFVSNPKKIMRITGCRDADIIILEQKGYIKIFRSGILIITDWRINNYIRADRYTPTIHQSEYAEYQALTAGIPDGIPMGDTDQSSIVKVKQQQQHSAGIPDGIPAGDCDVDDVEEAATELGDEEQAVLAALTAELWNITDGKAGELILSNGAARARAFEKKYRARALRGEVGAGLLIRLIENPNEPMPTPTSAGAAATKESAEAAAARAALEREYKSMIKRGN